MSGISESITPEQFTTFGTLLRYLRERAGFSQREFALEVGYHYSYLSRVEKNERLPDLATIKARFIPALGLEREPLWTARLLDLATKPTVTESPVSANAELTRASVASIGLAAPSLPTHLTPLLGREDESAGIMELLLHPNIRVVTIIGSPGVGKTRLALHIAQAVAERFSHGIHFVDLAELKTASELLPALSEALGFFEAAETALQTTLVNALKQKEVLLVLDNFERVVEAAPRLLALLGAAPGVKILATSREALRISGEHEFPLSPLPLPPLPPPGATQLTSDQEHWLEMLPTYASVQLFVQRAQAVNPGFRITSENAQSVAEICRILDGLPLALELAAARVKILAPQAMLAQFKRRADWLSHSGRATSTRQTLSGAVGWSYNLLSEAEQVLLRRLSVFSGGWALAAAEAICSDEMIARDDIFDLLLHLTDKSLVLTESFQDDTRYHFLDTVRQFSLEELEKSHEVETLHNRHLSYFAAFAEEAEQKLEGLSQLEWYHRCDTEHNNIRAALNWSLSERGSLQAGLHLAAAISLYWLDHGHMREGITWLDNFLARPNISDEPEVEAKLLYRRAGLAYRVDDFVTGQTLGQRSIELSRPLEDQRYLACALYYFGENVVELKDFESARLALDESLSICTAIQYEAQLPLSICALGTLYMEEGDQARAQLLFEEALNLATQNKDTWVINHALNMLSTLHRNLGDFEKATDYFERALPISIQLGDRFAEGQILANLALVYNLTGNFGFSNFFAEQAYALFDALGDEVRKPFPLRMMAYAALQAGNIERAIALTRESLKGNRALDHLVGQLACLVALAECELAQQDVKQAARLLTFVETGLQREALQLMAPDRVALERVSAQVNGKLSRAARKAEQEKGRGLSLAELLAYYS